MNGRLRRSDVSAVAFVAWAAVNIALGQNGSVVVTVVDSNDLPVADATVTVGHSADFVFGGPERTDVHGVLQFREVRPGDGYWVAVAYPHCYLAFREDLRVGISRTLRVRIQLGADECPEKPPAGLSDGKARVPGSSIPADLESALEELRRIIHPDRLQPLQSGDDVFDDPLLRPWVRRSWGLGNDSRLCQYFQDLGVDRSDDMARIVVVSLSRRLSGRPIELEDQNRFYREYWSDYETRMEPPVNAVCPEHRSKLDLEGEIDESSRYDTVRVMHIGRCTANGEIWLYEYEREWYKPSKSVQALLAGEDTQSD